MTEKYELPCASCDQETIVIDLFADAEYECTNCGWAFLVEVNLTPFSMTLFEITPLTSVH